jgi:uncharacterized membrane protein YhaH (DUF805 family)
MSPARKAFWWVFLAGLALGIIIGLLKIVAPDSVSVTLNNEQVTGVTALLVGAFSGGIPGLIFGLIAAGIVKLATRGSKKAT